MPLFCTNEKIYQERVEAMKAAIIDDEVRVQVGGEDYKIDLLFFHRGLQCLVAFELKIGRFKPEYISKMDFYLEALDRQKKKKHENPSVGMILCVLMLSLAVMISLCHADMRLPGYLSWNVSCDGAAIRPYHGRA